jgi:hypothetical protein
MIVGVSSNHAVRARRVASDPTLGKAAGRVAILSLLECLCRAVELSVFVSLSLAAFLRESLFVSA